MQGSILFLPYWGEGGGDVVNAGSVALEVEWLTRTQVRLRVMRRGWGEQKGVLWEGGGGTRRSCKRRPP